MKKEVRQNSNGHLSFHLNLLNQESEHIFCCSKAVAIALISRAIGALDLPMTVASICWLWILNNRHMRGSTWLSTMFGLCELFWNELSYCYNQMQPGWSLNHHIWRICLNKSWGSLIQPLPTYSTNLSSFLYSFNVHNVYHVMQCLRGSRGYNCLGWPRSIRSILYPRSSVLTNLPSL